MIRLVAIATLTLAVAGCQNSNSGESGDSRPITEQEKLKKKKKVNLISAEEAAKNYQFQSDHLIGSWLCEWIDDPKGVGSQYVYRFYADGNFAAFYPKKETHEGAWWVTNENDGQWLNFEKKNSIENNMNLKSKGLIHVNKKGDFEVHAFFQDGVEISSDKLRFTRYVPGTIHDYDVITDEI